MVTIAGTPKPLTGGIDFNVTAGDNPGEANFEGNLNINVTGLGPLSQALSTLTIKCDGTLSIDADQVFPVVNKVHFVVNGKLDRSMKPIVGSGTFDVMTEMGAPLAFEASGPITFAQQP
jgi:hypothetical protein